MADPTFRYVSSTSVSGINNIAADRANIALLNCDTAIIDHLTVVDTLDLPDGSLQIITEGGGFTLVQEPQPDRNWLLSDRFHLKSLVGGTDITLSKTDDELTIDALGASAVTLTSAGGQTIVVPPGGTVQLRARPE